MKFLLSIIVLLSISCERHKNFSTIQDNETINSSPLTAKEDLLKAYIEEDFKTLDRLREGNVDLDLILSNKKNLLSMAILDHKYKMIYYLVQNKSDIQLYVTIDERSIRVVDILESITDIDKKEIVQALLNQELAHVNKVLFQNELANDSKSSLDLDWLKVLLEFPLDFSLYEQKEFFDLFISGLSNKANVDEFYKLLMHLDLPNTQWQEWTEDAFIKGRYRSAKCQIDTQNFYVNFKDFLNICEEKYRSRLVRAEDSIWPTIRLRNYLLLE